MAKRLQQKDIIELSFDCPGCDGKPLTVRLRKVYSFREYNMVSYLIGGEPVQPAEEDVRVAREAMERISLPPDRHPDVLAELATRRRVARCCGPEAAGLVFSFSPDSVGGRNTYRVQASYLMGRVSAYLMHGIPGCGAFYPAYGMVERPEAVDEVLHVPDDPAVLEEIRRRIEWIGGEVRWMLVDIHGPEFAGVLQRLEQLKQLLMLSPVEQLSRWEEIEEAASAVYSLVPKMKNLFREMVRRDAPPEQIAVVAQAIHDASTLGVSPARLQIRRELLEMLPEGGVWEEEPLARFGRKRLVKVWKFVLVQEEDGRLRFPEVHDLMGAESEDEENALMAAVDQNLMALKQLRDTLSRILRIMKEKA